MRLFSYYFLLKRLKTQLKRFAVFVFAALNVKHDAADRKSFFLFHLNSMFKFENKIITP